MFGRVPTEVASMLGVCIEGFFLGLYTAIFIMYLQYQTSKRSVIDIVQNVLFYLICILYVLSVVTIIGDTVDFIITYLDTARPPSNSLLLHLAFLQVTVTGCCDFLAQLILIYRCWVVWGHKIRVVVIPLFLSIAFLGIWLTNNSSWYFSSSGIATPTNWGSTMFLTSLVLSLVVNALATGLIVLRIFAVYQQVKPTSEEKSIGTLPGGRKLLSVMFIIIESGMALFSMQLIRLVLYLMSSESAVMQGYAITLGIDQMVHGIIPTIILVRVSMGLSFHDEESMVEAATTLRFQVQSDKSGTLNSVDSGTVVRDSEEFENNKDGDATNIGSQQGKDNDINALGYDTSTTTVQV